MHIFLPTLLRRVALACALLLPWSATYGCDAAAARRALELRVDDFQFPVERVALYESQVELRAELRLRAAGVEPRRPTARARCLLRVAVVPADAGLRVDVTFGSLETTTYDGAELVVPAIGGRAQDRAATAAAILAAVDRQIDLFVASLQRHD